MLYGFVKRTKTILGPDLTTNKRHDQKTTMILFW